MKEIEINEIEGFRIGNAQDKEGGTGCTAILCDEGAAWPALEISCGAQ